MGDIKVLEFKKNFPLINLEFMKTHPYEYEIVMLMAYMNEFEKGFMIKKIGKTYKKGTTITCKPIENKEELAKYIIKMQDLLNKFNEKHNTDLQFTLEKKNQTVEVN